MTAKLFAEIILKKVLDMTRYCNLSVLLMTVIFFSGCGSVGAGSETGPDERVEQFLDARGEATLRLENGTRLDILAGTFDVPVTVSLAKNSVEALILGNSRTLLQAITIAVKPSEQDATPEPLLPMNLTFSQVNSSYDTNAIEVWHRAISGQTDAVKHQNISMVAVDQNILAATSAQEINVIVMLALNTSSQPTESADTIAPSVGSAVHFSNVSENSIGVSYGTASDNTTAAADLRYKVVTANTATDIDTVDEANVLTGAGLLSDWSVLGTVTHNSLTHSTTYCYSVLVKDSAENISQYSPVCQVTASRKRIFISASTTVGDFDSNNNSNPIEEADAICQSDANKPVGAGTYKALLVDNINRRAEVGSQLDWVLVASKSYYRTDGVTPIVTTTADRIFPANLTNAMGTVLALVWTGLNSDWTTGNVCASWSSSLGVSASVGSNLLLNTGVISDLGLHLCSDNLGFYCVEQ